MIPLGCDIHNHSGWFLLGRDLAIQTVAYLQTVSLILKIFSSAINSHKILSDERFIR